MAYTIVYSVPEYSRNKFSSFKNVENISPYMHWYQMNEEIKVMFSYDLHMGCDICTHLTFIPDMKSESGTLLYRYNGDYTYYDVCAKILIDVDKKTLYINNCIIDYDHFPMSFNDIKFKGGIRAFKRDSEYESVIKNMTELFFGKDWRCYSRYKKKNIIKERKKLFKNLKNLTHLPYDIHEYIVNKMMKWQDVKKITFEDIDYFKKKIEENIGAKASEYGKYYAWGSLIGVYDFNDSDIDSEKIELIN